MAGRPSARRGIALVLASGVLSLLLLVSFLTVSLSRVFAVQSAGGADRAGASLAAASGMEYAAGRLARDGDPGGVSWNRRLRPGDTRFASRAEPLDGRIPLNAGYLRAADLMRETAHGPSGIPDCRDTSLRYHRSLAHVLNNLGWILGIGARRWSIPAGDLGAPGEPLEISWLGMDLLGNRPPGGYRDWRQVEEILLDLGVGYTVEDVERIRPFIDLSTDGKIAASRTSWFEGDDVPDYIPVNLTAARPEVLESLFRYVGIQSPSDFLSEGANEIKYTRSGPAGAAGTKTYADVFILVWPDEARALAACLTDLRAAGPLSWQGIYREFSARAPLLFAREWGELAAHGLFRRAWVQEKADCAFQAVCLDPYPYGNLAHGGSTAWAGWGIDRFPDDPAFPASLGFQPLPISGFANGVIRIEYPPGDPDDLLSPPYPLWPQWGFGNSFAPYVGAAFARRQVCPQGGVLGPSCRFEVACTGRSGTGIGTAEGEFAAAERLDLTSQEDFDNLSEGRALRARGIETIDPDPPARYEWRMNGAPHDRLPDGSFPVYGDPAPGVPGPGRAPGDVRIQARTATLPIYNRRSLDFSGAPAPGVSRQYGAVTLARFEAGVLGAALYWPFSQDFDRAPDPAVSSDAWHETGPLAVPAPPARPMSVMARGTDLSPYGANAISGYGAGPPGSFDCPGIVEGAPVTPFSVEFRMGKDGYFDLRGEDGSSVTVTLRRTSSGGRLGNSVSLRVEWRERPPPPFAHPASEGVWFVPDGAGGLPDAPFDRHLVLTVLPLSPTDYRFRVFLGGSDLSDAGSMILDHPYAMEGTALETLEFRRISHLRIYDETLHVGKVTALRGLGRFCRRGTFESPVYRFDGPVRLARAQWTGIVPHGYPESSLRVEAFARDDAGAERRMLLGPSGLVESLADLGSAREFGYRVLFDCETGMSGIPVDDTPVFESIWFTFSRPGRTPAWRRWGPN